LKQAKQRDMKTSFTITAILICVGLIGQTTVTLQPNATLGKDASLGSHTNYGTENNNYGTNVYFNAYCIPGSQGGQNTNRAIIDFDLSSIPAGATIVSADLTLYATGYINSLLPGHFGNNTCTLKRITSSWSENTVTWNSAPTTTAVNQVTMPQSSSANQDYTTSVTSLVQDMITNPSTSFGFYFALVTENPSNAAGLLFYSSDHTDQTKWPKLVITYTIGNCIQPDPNSGNDASLGSHTNFGTENNNYGTNQYFNAYCIPGAQGGQNTNRALIKFDLSSIPSSAVVTSADLYLYATGYINSLLPGHFGNNASILERVTSTWSESTVTWNTAPTTTTVGSATLPQSTSATQDYVVNVTAMTQYQVTNPAQNFGYYFRLITENPSNSAGLLFWSSDYSNPLERPQLCVTYQDSLNPKGIEEHALLDVEILVYPSPATDEISIATENGMSNSVINIYDSQGRIVKTQSQTEFTQTFRIGIADLSEGTYFIELIGEEKRGIATFIKSL
jgi:hypothetical protein